MEKFSSKVGRIVAGLKMGVAVPFLYFGIQFLASLFCPGYSFLNQDASTLGSASSRFPGIFNVGSIIVGLLTLVVSMAFMRSFELLRARRILAWLTFFALLSFGVMSINAGIHPLPDPRHTGGVASILGLGMFILPVLMPAASWKIPIARRIRVYYIFNIILLMILFPVISGLVQYISVKSGYESMTYQKFLNGYHGLLQRIVALIAIAPIGVGAYSLATRIKTLYGDAVAPQKA